MNRPIFETTYSGANPPLVRVPTSSGYLSYCYFYLGEGTRVSSLPHIHWQAPFLFTSTVVFKINQTISFIKNRA